jgi:hypothetical protein
MEHKAHETLRDALSDPSESMRNLARVGVTFPLTWWQRLLLKIPYKRAYRMQRYVLKNMKKRSGDE